MDNPEDRLALIECHERDGRVGRVLDVWRWPVSLGRALDNHVVLDDVYVAAHHVLLRPGENGGVQLLVLDTVNGVVVDGRRHGAGACVDLPAGGASLQIGAGKLRLRLSGETLAPEQRLPGGAATSRWTPLLLGLAAMALALAELAAGLDPGADTTAWLPTAVGLPAVLLLWCGLWALMSKLFQHRFDFVGHLRIALPWLVSLQVVDLVLPQLGASLGWPWLWRLAPAVQALLAALLVRRHLVQVLPQHVRAVTAAVAAAVLVGGGITLTLTHRATDSLSRSPYMSTLPLPALNWTRPMSTDSLVDDMSTLGPALARRVEKAQTEEAEQGGDAND